MGFQLDLFSTVLIIFIISILILLWIGNKKGWFKEKPPGLSLNAADGAVDLLPNGQPNTAKYNNIARGVRSNLDAWNYTDEGMTAAYNAVIPLNKNELRLVVNEYNSLYAGESYPTIRDLLNGESLACGSWMTFWYTSPACEKRRELLDKLAEIGA